jgi:hypothetical protein
VQITPETCRANDERNKEYSLHLFGPELNIYILCVLKHLNIMYTLNTTYQRCLSSTCFHSAINLYTTRTALNQEQELNEGIIDFSVYRLMLSSVTWKSHINVQSKPLELLPYSSYVCELVMAKHISSVRGLCTQISIDFSEPRLSVIQPFFPLSYLYLFVLYITLKIFHKIYAKNMIWL